MNGAADMGGMHGFGPVQVEANEPVFHADWEKKAFALNIAIGVANIWNLDEFRFARESLPPPQYLNMSYYGLWVATLENMMLQYKMATPEELQEGRAHEPVKKAKQPVTAAQWRTWSVAARLTSALRLLRRNSRLATEFARGTSIRKPTHDCHATSGGTPVRSCVLSDVTSFPTAMRVSARRIRIGFIRFASNAANCGDRIPIPMSESRSKLGSPTWKSLERGPDCGILAKTHRPVE
jgi:Nitrile hydratase beta subunit, N-terminal